MPCAVAKTCRKCTASSGTSEGRSRSAGISMWTASSRWKRSSRSWPSRDQLRQVAPAGSDHPHVGGDRLVAAGALEAPALEKSPQLDLQPDRERVDLLEKERAALALARAARRVGVAAPGSVLLPEELAVEHRLRVPAAGEPHEGARAARGLFSWIAAAISALPVPGSPVSSTLVRPAAACATVRNTACIGAELPTMFSKR